MNFEIRNDLVIKYRQQDYSTDDLSQAVSYWLDHIQQNANSLPIGIAYCQLSFSAVALILAIYKSQHPFVHLGGHSLKLDHDTQAQFNLSHVYVVGATEEDEHFFKIPFNFTRTDAWQHAWAMAHWSGREKLDIPFSENQEITCYTGGTTGRPRAIKMSAELESLSIRVAQELFFDSKDYCVFQHSIGHPGVHTTALLPALFTARVVSLADLVTWDTEIQSATHIQYFYTMQYLFRLPPRLRMLTTGGSMLKPVFLDFVKQQCQYDHFFDIYGLTECLPPLAVREIHSYEDLEQPFTWVNHAYSFETVIDKLRITRPDGVVIMPDDRGMRMDGQLKFYGRDQDSQQIRVRGHMTTFADFRLQFESATGIVRYVLYNKNGSPHLQMQNTDRITAEKWLLDNQVEVDPEYFDNLKTSGGIKTIV